jgi:hypothetical protein
MKRQVFALCCLLLVTSCEPQPKSQLLNGGFPGVRTNEALENHEAIGKEIVLIDQSFGDPWFNLTIPTMLSP